MINNTYEAQDLLHKLDYARLMKLVIEKDMRPTGLRLTQLNNTESMVDDTRKVLRAFAKNVFPTSDVKTLIRGVRITFPHGSELYRAVCLAYGINLGRQEQEERNVLMKVPEISAVLNSIAINTPRNSRNGLYEFDAGYNTLAMFIRCHPDNIVELSAGPHGTPMYEFARQRMVGLERFKADISTLVAMMPNFQALIDKAKREEEEKIRRQEQELIDRSDSVLRDLLNL